MALPSVPGQGRECRPPGKCIVSAPIRRRQETHSNANVTASSSVEALHSRSESAKQRGSIHFCNVGHGTCQHNVGDIHFCNVAFMGLMVGLKRTSSRFCVEIKIYRLAPALPRRSRNQNKGEEWKA